jgi:2-methylcitrate dehydratase PrpD
MQGLGEDWHLSKNYFKLHSCCRYNHGTLDALDQCWPPARACPL